MRIILNPCRGYWLPRTDVTANLLEDSLLRNSIPNETVTTGRQVSVRPLSQVMPLRFSLFEVIQCVGRARVDRGGERGGGEERDGGGQRRRNDAQYGTK